MLWAAAHPNRSGTAVTGASRPLVVSVLAALVVTTAASTVYVLWAFPEFTERTPGQQIGQVVSVAIGILVTAALAWRRPGNRMWRLLALFLFVGVAQDFGPPNPWVMVPGQVTAFLSYPAFMHLGLAYPSGCLTGRPRRILVTAAYLVASFHGLGDALASSRYLRYPVERRYPSVLHITALKWLWPDGVTDALDTALRGLALVGLVVLVATTWQARRRVTAVYVPLLVTSILAGVVFLGSAIASLDGYFEVPVLWAMLGLQALVPVALVVGLLAQERARAVVADLVLALDHAPPDGIEAALARALRDPTLRLHLLAEDGTVLGAGSSDAPTAPYEPYEPYDRLLTPVLSSNGRPIARIESAAHSDDHPELLPAVAAAARFAIEHAAMSAQLRRQVAELQASRERIVEAAAAERRRIERNLHDGAQQQLLALGMHLDRVRRRMRGSPSATDVVSDLDQAIASLRATLAELQVLARGVHPPILSSRGLVPAVRSLIERIPVPIDLDADLDQRFDPAAEATAYFVVSEALGNALRHARATRIAVWVGLDGSMVTVGVHDDGVGGADPTSDGLRSLADRVAGRGGRLTVSSPAGAGTLVEASLPCG